MTAEQLDLLPLYRLLDQDIVGDRSIMAYPFFGLDRKPSMTPIIYETDQIKIEVRPSHDGLATIYDKEVILYVASLVAQRVTNGEPTTQDFQFTAHDFFNATATNLGGRSYARMDAMLTRLQGTQIRTNIETGGEGEAGAFSWLSEYQLSYAQGTKGDKRLRAVRVRLCNWLYRAIVNNLEFLKYSTDYFDLGPVERRLYEVALAACPEGGTLEIDVADLRHQVGYKSTINRFRIELKRISDGQTIPDFTMALTNGATPQPARRGPKTGFDKVTISPRIT